MDKILKRCALGYVCHSRSCVAVSVRFDQQFFQICNTKGGFAIRIKLVLIAFLGAGVPHGSTAC